MDFDLCSGYSGSVTGEDLGRIGERHVSFSLQIPLIVVDSLFYGQLVISPLNHIVYNLFSGHGPSLYGR